MERVILGQPGKTSHVQWCLLFPPETSPPRWPQHLTAALLPLPVRSDCLIPSYATRPRSFPAPPSFSMPFSWHLSPCQCPIPGLFLWGGEQKPFLSLAGSLLVPPGSVPPPGRFGPLELTKKEREAVPGVVYWLGSSILSLHNYGFCM